MRPWEELKRHGSAEVLFLCAHQYPPAVPAPNDLRVTVVVSETGRRFDAFEQFHEGIHP